ncbi:S41 family peptidase [Streptomyces sp. S6]
MSGPDLFSQPRRFGRGATLTLVFASVLVAGAATGSLPQGGDGTGHARAVVPDGRRQVAQAAAEAMAQGKSPTEAAERAVSRSGDRWAAVYSEGEFEEFEQSLDGEYTGVGLWARRESDGRIAVSKVSGDSPAAEAGIRAGDRLRSVDGRAVDGLPVTDVLSLLRGDATGAPAGTAVRLGLERGTRAWAETVRRATLSTEPVTVEKIRSGGTLVRVSAFTKGVGEAVRAAAREASGGVVLDLRGNSGGLVTEAVAAASVFLDGGLVATYDMDGAQRALHAGAGGDTARPLVVLVDGGTMSAAELLTGALQDRGRAVVVGSRTFGKGSVQMPTRLPDGSVAELTVGHYRTPSGHAVDGVGITPDLEVGDGVLERAERVLSGSGRMP